MNAQKQQLIQDFSSDISRMLVEWEIFKDIDMERRSMLAYADVNQKKSLQWNLWWQRDLQAAWDAIGNDWKMPVTKNAVYAASDLLCSNTAISKLGVHWSIPLRTVARDALLLSAAIVAYGDLQHPTSQHAIARWKLWQHQTFVLGDYKNTILSIPFVEKAKR